VKKIENYFNSIVEMAIEVVPLGMFFYFSVLVSWFRNGFSAFKLYFKMHLGRDFSKNEVSADSILIV
jgi:hypothetical protein